MYCHCMCLSVNSAFSYVFFQIQMLHIRFCYVSIKTSTYLLTYLLTERVLLMLSTKCSANSDGRGRGRTADRRYHHCRRRRLQKVRV